jgi:cytochrome P450
VCLLAFWCVYNHLQLKTCIDFYEKQGAIVYPGARRFLLGNILEFGTYTKVATASPEAFTGPVVYLFKEFCKARGLAHFDMKDSQMVVMSILGQA